MQAQRRKSILVAGSSHPELALELSELTGLELFPLSLFCFPDGERRVQLSGSVLGKQAFVVQSLGRAPNELLVETLLIVDALRRGGAERIVLVCPYLAYSRQNVQETEGVSVAARLFADFMQHAGVSHLITVDLHTDVVGSFYTFPVEHISARDAFCTALKEQNLLGPECVVVGPDLGASKLAARYSRKLLEDGVVAGNAQTLALIEKRRDSARQVTMLSLLGEVRGKNVLLADDVCSTAQTLLSASFICRERGAKQIFACVTHGIFSEDALKRLDESPIERLFVSNTVAHLGQTSAKLCIVSIARDIARCITRLVKEKEEQFI